MERRRHLARTLGQGLARVERELPHADYRIREANGAVTARVQIGAQSFLLLLAAPRQRVVDDDHRNVDVETKMSLATFDALLDGRLNLYQAIIGGVIFARGTAAALLALGDALAWFVTGVLCSDAADELLDDLRGTSTNLEERA